MTCSLDYLRSQVLWSPTKACGLLVLRQMLGHSEVSKSDIAQVVHEDVFRLQVSVYYVLGVQVT